MIKQRVGRAKSLHNDEETLLELIIQSRTITRRNEMKNEVEDISVINPTGRFHLMFVFNSISACSKAIDWKQGNRFRQRVETVCDLIG